MPLDAQSLGQQQGGIPRWMLGLHNAIDPVQALGGYGNVAAMALPMGRMAAMPMAAVKPGIYGPGTYRVTQSMPGGAEMAFDVSRTSGGGLNASVNFGGGMKGGSMMYGQPTEGIKTGINRLGEVFQSVENFVSRVKPESISFAAGSSGLKELYNRVAPQMAKRLGGVLDDSISGIYSIRFPNAAKYPLSK